MKLTKSQRVTIISDIGGRLDSEEWTTIDLILKQFSFPTRNEWSSDKRGYVVEMIGDAEDVDLLELAQHFGMKVSSQEPAIGVSEEAAHWDDGRLRVFISHLSTEKELAANIQTSLSRFGMSSFVAHNDIHPTVEWQLEIETALSSCELLVALLHPKFIESQWCDQEIGYALGRGVPVFTVRCGADPYGFVSRFQAFNGAGKSAPQNSQELFDAARVHKKLQSKMADVLVDLFINSGNFASAKARISFLEDLTTWDASYSERLTKALKTNSQIQGSWGVPEQVAKLLKKWK
jgi:hypothetical protein